MPQLGPQSQRHNSITKQFSHKDTIQLQNSLLLSSNLSMLRSSSSSQRLLHSPVVPLKHRPMTVALKFLFWYEGLIFMNTCEIPISQHIQHNTTFCVCKWDTISLQAIHDAIVQKKRTLRMPRDAIQLKVYEKHFRISWKVDWIYVK